MFETREMMKFADSFIRKHLQETFPGKVGRLVPHKVDMVMGRGMRTALEAGVEVCVGPAGGAGDDRQHAMITEGDKEAGGRMGKFFEVRGEVARTSCGGYVGGPIRRGTQMLQGRRVHNLT
jgi:hypothetical protein